jgi:hypothetical protein
LSGETGFTTASSALIEDMFVANRILSDHKLVDGFGSRDGAARAGLQSHARHEHLRRPAAPGGDVGVVARRHAAICHCRTAQDGRNPLQKHFQTENPPNTVTSPVVTARQCY